MLHIKNLYCNYRNINIIKNISFTSLKNENLCIIGPNGCGKTTLLKAIAGIIPYTGSITFNGESISSMKRRDIAKSIALMSQISEIYFPYSIFDTVSLGRYSHKKGIFKETTSEEKDFILSCIENVGLLDKKDKMINELSGGQIQRVFLAKAFAQDPRVLLLDEPTNHLDLKSQIELLEYINKWKSLGDRSVVGVIHDLNLVRNFGEKVIVMKNGEIVLNDSPREAFNNTILKDVYGLDVKRFMINTLEKWV